MVWQMTPCAICGGQKERGVKGVKHCPTCRETSVSTVTREHERARESGRAPSRALVLASLPSFCEACQGTGVMTLAAHWTGAEVDLPAQVDCPHCRYPFLPISTY